MAKQDSGWAPWYYYVPVLAVGHAIAQFAFLGRADQVTNAIASIVLTIVLIAAVTLGWRATRKNRV
jgi:hypothetical protein